MLKKILPALILISFLAVLIIPAAALAQTEVPTKCYLTREIGFECPSGGTRTAPVPCPYSTANCGICCTLNTIYNIVDWFFVALIAIAGFFVLMGAFTFLTSAGSPEGTTKGRNYIMYAAIGVGLAFLAKALPAIVRTIIGA